MSLLKSICDVLLRFGCVVCKDYHWPWYAYGQCFICQCSALRSPHARGMSIITSATSPEIHLTRIASACTRRPTVPVSAAFGTMKYTDALVKVIG